jgi:flavin reductase (NADH)
MASPSDPSTAVDAADFRSLMARFPTGVAVVTAIDEAGRPAGMTCSSLSSVTLRPPTLLVCLRVESATLDAIHSRGTFAVNFLHSHAQRTAELFGSGAPRRFSAVCWAAPGDAAGPHLINDAHSIADCVVSAQVPFSTHVVVFGTVQRISEFGEEHPLLYGRRRYAAWRRA